jgi:hypothetical protein
MLNSKYQLLYISDADLKTLQNLSDDENYAIVAGAYENHRSNGILINVDGGGEYENLVKKEDLMVDT